MLTFFKTDIITFLNKLKDWSRLRRCSIECIFLSFSGNYFAGNKANKEKNRAIAAICTSNSYIGAIYLRHKNTLLSFTD